MSHFSNLAKAKGVSTYRLFPAFQSVKWRADTILKGRDSIAIECAASYVIQSIEEFKFEELATQIEARVQHLSENGGWELGYLQRTDHHADDAAQRLTTTDDIRDLLNNWPRDADDSPPTYDQCSDVDALGEILCSGDIYQWDWIDGCKNASEAELYAVLALIKLDDVARTIFMPEKWTEAGISIYQPGTAIGIAKAVDAANVLIEAVESVCSAQREVDNAVHHKYQEEARGETVAARRLERLEIAKLARKATATAAATVRHSENRSMKSDVFNWLDTNMKNFKSMDAAAEAIAGKIAPIVFRTARDWVTEWKKLRSASTP